MSHCAKIREQKRMYKRVERYMRNHGLARLAASQRRSVRQIIPFMFSVLGAPR